MVLAPELLPSTLSYLMLTLTLQFFKSLFTNSFHVKFGLPLPLLIIGPTYYPATNRFLRGPLLDMSKPYQMMLHKLPLDWCHP
jgi:hypothetical protein